MTAWSEITYKNEYLLWFDKCPNFKNVMGEIVSCWANAVFDAANIDWNSCRNKY